MVPLTIGILMNLLVIYLSENISLDSEDRNDPDSLHVYPVREGLSQKPVDSNIVPRFEERPSYQSVIFPVILLILFNLLFFTAAQLSFLKSDLK